MKGLSRGEKREKGDWRRSMDEASTTSSIKSNILLGKEEISTKRKGIAQLLM